MYWVLTNCFLYVSSQGELSYDGFQVRVFDFLTSRSSIHTGHSNAPSCFAMHGHGGADYCLMDAFISAVAVSIISVFKFVIVIVGFCRDFVLAHCIQLSYRMWRPWLAWLICFVSFVCSFVCLCAQNNDPSYIYTGPEDTLMSHLLVFQAERSRLESRVVYCGESAQS